MRAGPFPFGRAKACAKARTRGRPDLAIRIDIAPESSAFVTARTPPRRGRRLIYIRRKVRHSRFFRRSILRSLQIQRNFAHKSLLRITFTRSHCFFSSKGADNRPIKTRPRYAGLLSGGEDTASPADAQRARSTDIPLPFVIHSRSASWGRARQPWKRAGRRKHCGGASSMELSWRGAAVFCRR